MQWLQWGRLPLLLHQSVPVLHLTASRPAAQEAINSYLTAVCVGEGQCLLQRPRVVGESLMNACVICPLRNAAAYSAQHLLTAALNAIGVLGSYVNFNAGAQQHQRYPGCWRVVSTVRLLSASSATYCAKQDVHGWYYWSSPHVKTLHR